MAQSSQEGVSAGVAPLTTRANGERDDEACPAVGAGMGADSSTEGFDHPPGHGKGKAAAPKITLNEGREDRSRILRSDLRPAVLDLKLNL